jgi:hypothetical protein
LLKRWEDFCTFGSDEDPFDETGLRRVLGRVISNDTHRFFFLIDGLDEFEGEPKEIIQLVVGTARANVKLCVGSNPCLPFEDVFYQRPSLLLKDLTRQDIAIYVSTHFEMNNHFVRLQKSDSHVAFALMQNIVQKASGVFLWVYLVVQSLLEGLQNSGHLPDLQARLHALPGDLEALFDKLLGRLSLEYSKQSCEVFRLSRTYHEMTCQALKDSESDPILLFLYLADEQDTKSSLDAPVKILDTGTSLQQPEIMRRRLNARCKGFLEVYHVDDKPCYNDKRVGYLHRTARNFIES